jgi:hypothetical protein
MGRVSSSCAIRRNCRMADARPVSIRPPMSAIVPDMMKVVPGAAAWFGMPNPIRARPAKALTTPSASRITCMSYRPDPPARAGESTQMANLDLSHRPVASRGCVGFRSQVPFLNATPIRRRTNAAAEDTAKRFRPDVAPVVSPAYLEAAARA